MRTEYGTDGLGYFVNEPESFYPVKTKGKLIVIEGVDGSGKTTQIEMLAERIRKSEYYKALRIATYSCYGFPQSVPTGIDPLLVTRQPGGSDFGQALRSILLSQDSDLSPLEELFLFQADRANHIRTVVKPHLDAGGIVLCDRWTHSTLAYQGYGKGLNLDFVTGLNHKACQGVEPDITFFLDISEDDRIERLQSKQKDRMEANDPEFFKRVREGYKQIFMSLGNTVRIVQVADVPKEAINDIIVSVLKESQILDI